MEKGISFYRVSLDLFSEDNFKGNMSRYYLYDFPKRGKVTFVGSIMLAHKYSTFGNAKKAGEKLLNQFPRGRVNICGCDYLGVEIDSTTIQNIQEKSLV